jgi:hypothetical protein
MSSNKNNSSGKKAAKRPGGGKKPAGGKRGKNFSPTEVKLLLDLIEEKLPLGSQEYETLIEPEYNKAVSPDRSRSAEDLRNKFKKLRNVKKPTGDPSCPEEVKRAKRIHRKIEGRMAVADFNQSDDDDDDEEDNESGGDEEEDDDEVLLGYQIHIANNNCWYHK